MSARVGAEHPLVRAARKVVDRHRGQGDLATTIDAIDELAKEVDDLDAALRTTAAAQ